MHKRFEAGHIKSCGQILEHFTEKDDRESLMIDAIVRAHPCAARYAKDQSVRECLGRSKGGAFLIKLNSSKKPSIP